MTCKTCPDNGIEDEVILLEKTNHMLFTLYVCNVCEHTYVIVPKPDPVEPPVERAEEEPEVEEDEQGEDEDEDAPDITVDIDIMSYAQLQDYALSLEAQFDIEIDRGVKKALLKEKILEVLEEYA